MAKIHIENGKISSSGDYGLYHGTSQIASIESSGLRVVGDILAENFVVSSSVTHFTQSFSSGSTIFGDDSGDTHKFTGSLQISGGLNLRGKLYLVAKYLEKSHVLTLLYTGLVK